MPRLKTPQQFGGLHLVLHDDLQRYFKRRRYDFSLPSNPALRPPHSARMPGACVPLNRDEILMLIRVAERPDYLSSCRSCERTLKAFGILFAKWPDEVLDILRFIRMKLAYLNTTEAGRATLFLRTHSYISNAKGNKIAVATMTDNEIAQHLTQPGFNMKPTNVKMARQKIAREDKRKFFFTENPQIQAFYRGTGGMIRKGKKTGQPNAKLKRLLQAAAKGKT